MDLLSAGLLSQTIRRCWRKIQVYSESPEQASQNSCIIKRGKTLETGCCNCIFAYWNDGGLYDETIGAES